MALLGNIIWFIFGGFVMGLGWWLAGIIAFISIIGIPWAKSCFVIGRFAFLPFGYEAINRRELQQKDDIGTSAFGTLGNILWLIFFGWWLALGHLISAIAFFIIIIGIPFGIQHLKLAAIALMPIGQTVVPKEVARAAREKNAHDHVDKLRNK
ncbi:YccF domain-containing protein [Pseudidiomarina terrestris]|uniref:Inner membrane protein YccF n=1 Tax=Pseudidiomarina terrestris TaxID=2820060 RepID=A0AAW7R3J3_9GAMM|nr:MULTISPECIES: YccF domain-containing protein [unclassified Pseudidiomarina]MDN7125326.1 YccF domain-containing protein [Pseudidiomarina sp. 1APP75-32.1]MDN7127930.1 YccF domain-containing protein [Pseudidiomarina sp. 1APR75-33.1]MDN7130085.1 YccF domain-containing protein [Pseudidiomarina sp. 1APR75-15]MDN7135589.1 YccF domain-containing protein [Pseudidiomarina sp. 1ASP75-5]MDN7137372.1 YccF domain-containing protein [Pseudidiomarina sp. 1ASP75-14]